MRSLHLLGRQRHRIESCCRASVCRALVAVGTLASEHSKVRLAARDLGLRERCTELKEVEGKVGEAAAEVERLLRL